MTTKTYFAILHKDPDSAVGVVFPDLPGCFSAGKTYDKAIENAHEALQLYAEVETERGRVLPEPRSFDVLFADPEIRKEAQGAPFVGIGFKGVPRQGSKKSASVIRRRAHAGEMIRSGAASESSGVLRKKTENK